VSGQKHGYAPKYVKRCGTYNSWRDMRKRCSNPRYARYADYGGRGIRVCERWNSFPNFLEDMGEAAPGMTLERKDVNGNYEPDNCTWIPKSEQAANRRFCRRITFCGVTKTMTEWERYLGFERGIVGSRIRDYGWDPERAITTPSRGY
jgi:hypothetical protein